MRVTVRRWVWLALLVTSPLVGVASAALWVRSYWQLDAVTRVSHEALVRVLSWRGALVVSREAADGKLYRLGPAQGWRRRSADASSLSDAQVFPSMDYNPQRRLDWRWWNFAVRSQAAGQIALVDGAPATWPDTTYVAVPHATFVVVSAIVAAVAARRLRSIQVEARRAAGQCVRCGYDLRASPDRCPECGAADANAAPIA
jgi:hypothetical protein